MLFRKKMSVLTLKVGKQLCLCLLGTQDHDNDLESVNSVDFEVNFLSKHFLLQELNRVNVVHIFL